MVEFLGGDGFLHLDEVGKLHQPVIGAAHEDRFEVGRRHAVAGTELHDHVVLAALALEARDLPAAEQGFERTADVIDAHADVGDLVALQLHGELRLVQAQVRIDVGEARVLAQLREQRTRGGPKLRISM